MKQSLKLVSCCAVLAFLSAGPSALSADSPLKLAVIKALQGTATYSHNDDYSEAIPHMILGYDEKGEASIGIAVREIQAYRTLTAMLVVRRKGGAYVVDDVVIPDIDIIRSAKDRRHVEEALRTFGNQTVQDASGKVHRVDTVTQATRHQRRMYLSFNVMAYKIVEEMEGKPDWERRPTPKPANR